ncbi:MAG: FAD/NAD(P)-binding protein [Actinomycetota bacterium]|nr:FAD/NAD(P)-binding protein [Actinomycetota bacterium]
MLAERVSEPMEPQPYRVIEVRHETADVVTFTIEPTPGIASMDALPGQFNMLWAFGVGEVPISLSGLRPGGVLVHTVRSVGTVSEALTRLHSGEIVGVRGPFGRGWEVETAEGDDIVVVAGGIGFAPLRPVVEHALANRSAFGRVVVLVGARRPEEMIFDEDLLRWAVETDDIAVEVTVDAAGHDWSGHVGVVTELVGRARFDARHAVAFVCGPEVMMRFATRSLQERGVPLGRIRLSAERNMHCAVAHCGHCQLGEYIICRDGPVFDAARLLPLLTVRGR